MPPKPYLDIDHVRKAFPYLSDLVLFDAGGQKIVYKGSHPKYGHIMLKFFKTHEEDPRISREIAIAEKLVHPNLPKLHDVGKINFENDDSTVVYMIEEYIEGDTLRSFMISKSFDLSNCKHFIEVMFSLLETLKTHNLVHRDLKPENIMIKDGGFFILDFGIARELGAESITVSDAPMGPHTLGYAPWEQINNEKELISDKTDLFSIAVICQEMITGEHPFLIDDPAQNKMRQTFDLKIKPLKIASPIQKELEEFLHTLMSKNPSSRPNLQQALVWFNEFKEKM